MTFSVSMVRQLKGAPLSVYMVLMAVGQRVSQEWIERNTGYSDKPISQALAYLRDMGHVDHSSGGWGLAAAQQLVLGQGPEELPTEVLPSEEESNSDTNCQGRKVSDSALKEEEVLINNNINKLTSSSSSLSSESRKNSDLVIDLLERHGVFAGIARKLAPAFAGNLGALRAYIFELSLQPKYNPGILAYRLRQAPELVGKRFFWGVDRWAAWLAENQITGNAYLVNDLARDYPDPVEALEKLPLVGLTAEVIEACLWEVVA